MTLHLRSYPKKALILIGRSTAILLANQPMPIPYDFSASLLIDDFNTFVRYLTGKTKLSLTGAGDLKAADLWAINERVNYKAPDYVTSRSRQADYPLLNFLYQVITASRLVVVQF